MFVGSIPTIPTLQTQRGMAASIVDAQNIARWSV